MSLSDKEVNVHKTDNIYEKEFEGMYKKADVKQFIKELKEAIRGIPVIAVKDSINIKYQDTPEIWRRIDELAGEGLI